jgi:hypothetical protein
MQFQRGIQEIKGDPKEMSKTAANRVPDPEEV